MPESKKSPAKRAPAKKKPPAKRKAGTRGARTAAKSAAASATKKNADAAAKRAKDAGAKGSGERLSAAKKLLRNSAIMARKAQRVTNAAIAAEFDITERSVERIVADMRTVPSPLDELPMQILEELTTGLRISIGDYERMAFAWFDVNQSAALGAKKAADETRARLGALLAEVGKLPTNLELFRSEMEMQRIAEEMVGMMRAVAAGEKDAAEAVEFFRGLLDAREQRQLPAGA